MSFDLSTELGARVGKRLRDEQIVWLTTTGADGTPQPSPLWFLWNGETVVVFSEPKTPKVRNIGRTPRVALNFNTDEYGGDVAVITGTAAIDLSSPTAAELDAYLTKYAEGLKSLGWSLDDMRARYSTVLRITPEKLRGF
jgi:PPOX class probable F420-dependent enzyme